MPNIVEYNAPQGLTHLEPSNVGTESWALAGRRIGVGYNEMGREIGGAIAHVGGQVGEQIDRHEAFSQISAGSPQLAAASANMTDDLNAAMKNADPNDTSIGQGFMEKSFEPFAQHFLGQFSNDQAKAWAADSINRLRGHYTNVISADNVSRAGAAAQSNWSSFVNVTAGSLERDPTAWATQMALLEHTATGYAASSSVSSEESEKLRGPLLQEGQQRITESAVRGMMLANPAAGIAALNSGKYDKYLAPAQQQELQQFGLQATRAQGITQRMAEQDVVRQQKIKDLAAENSYYTQIGGGTYSKAALVQKVLRDQDLSPEGRERVLSMFNKTSQMVEAPVNDARTYSNLRDLGDKLTQRQVAEANADGKLDEAHYRDLSDLARANAEDPQKREDQHALTTMLTGFKPTIIAKVFGTEAAATQASRYAQFQQTIQERFDEGRTKGLTRQQMLDPMSPQYIAKDAQRWTTTSKEDMELSRARGAVTLPVRPAAQQKWTPGQSVDEYLREIGGK